MLKTRPRPPIPQRICDALTRLSLPLPPAGQVLPLDSVNQALAEAGASTAQKMQFKADLRHHLLINS